LHPHSEYITSFIEQGILGLISTLLVLFVPLRFFLVEYKKRKSKLSIFGSLVVLNYSIFAIFSGIFAHQVSTIFYTVIIAMIYGFMHNNKENFQ
jgi:O-antigen ligase